MKLPIIITILFNISTTSPDLCAEVYLDESGEPWTDALGQTLSRYCTWTGPRAPILNAEVCCDIDEDLASCWLPDPAVGCQTGSQWYCKHGEEVAGGVVCYRPYPDACESGFCVQAPELPPDVQEVLMCCTPGACQGITPAEMWECEGNGATVSWCQNGVSNIDGTVTCYD